MSKYAIENMTMTGIADAVRNLRNEKERMTPSEIEAKIRATRLGIPIIVSNHINSETGEWERPSDWPDVDALASQLGEDEECVYLTYDRRKTPGYAWAGVYVELENNGGDGYWEPEIGYIENGKFVRRSSGLRWPSSGSFIRDLEPDSFFGDDLDENGVGILRISCHDAHITRFGFVTNSDDSSKSFQNNMQPCVQRAGRLPWCKSWFGVPSTNPNDICGGTIWLERDSFSAGQKEKITTLSSCWRQCYSLQSLDLSGWKTDNWAVESLLSCWYQCYSLQSLDLSGWKTDKWAVTTLGSCWHQCYSLQSLDLSGWKTDKWAVTTLAYCWYHCYSLQSLDLSGWNTDNWAVTTLVSCWQQCSSLQSLDLSGWKTDNWVVTALANCWTACSSLQSLDLSGWKTDKWAVTTLAYCWYRCNSLQSLDLSGWKTDNWPVTTLFYCWTECCSLPSLDLSGWKTDKWTVTTLAYCWYQCYSLQSLDLSGWKTDKWAVTTLAYCWHQCFSLQSLDLSGWNTDNWPVTTLTNCWYQCFSLRSLEGCEKWKFVTNLTGNNAFVPDLENIEDFDGIQISIDHSYSNSFKLTPESLVNILNTLPTVTSSRKITLGQYNKLKLTDEQIKIATDKGWTVA